MLMYWKLIIVIITTTYTLYTCTSIHIQHASIIMRRYLYNYTKYTVHSPLHHATLSWDLTRGGENVEEPFVSNCEEGLAVRGEVNAPITCKQHSLVHTLAAWREPTSGAPVKLLRHKSKELLFEPRESSLAMWHTRRTACTNPPPPHFLYNNPPTSLLQLHLLLTSYKLSSWGVAKHGVNTMLLSNLMVAALWLL